MNLAIPDNGTASADGFEFLGCYCHEKEEWSDIGSEWQWGKPSRANQGRRRKGGVEVATTTETKVGKRVKWDCSRQEILYSQNGSNVLWIAYLGPVNIAKASDLWRDVKNPCHKKTFTHQLSRQQHDGSRSAQCNLKNTYAVLKEVRTTFPKLRPWWHGGLLHKTVLFVKVMGYRIARENQTKPWAGRSTMNDGSHATVGSDVIKLVICVSSSYIDLGEGYSKVLMVYFAKNNLKKDDASYACRCAHTCYRAEEGEELDQRWCGGVRSMTFSHDGKYVLSSTLGERYVDVWEVAGRKKKSACCVLAMDYPDICIDSR
ncbi:hypothetical protein Tco_1030182 [Tanacetum coccineum]|uniref:Transducin/WD40 repeat-like superfamily protein n=1 Tax=Tanacetum coccineum TaxID=301880 RepID=A0ABQ5G5S9_9ASTR